MPTSSHQIRPANRSVALVAAALAIASILLATSAGAELRSLDRNELTQAIRSTDDVLVVELTASWCVNCKLAERRVLGLAESFEAGIALAQVDVGRHASVMRKYAIDAVPAVLVFRDGREVARHVGVPSTEWLDSTVRDHGGRPRLARNQTARGDGVRIASASSSTIGLPPSGSTAPSAPTGR